MTAERDFISQQILGLDGGAAFLRRGREVELAFEAVVNTCLQKREEWLQFVRLELGSLFALAGSSAALAEFLGDAARLQTLEKLMRDLRPQLRVPPAPTTSARRLRRALADLRHAIERFNQRWLEFMAGLDLTHVNELRERYNRFYLLEKECALGPSRAARFAFQRLNPLQSDDFLKLIPPLPVP
jgi:hypothetical protein